MSTAFARASGGRATAGRMTTDAGFAPRSVPAALRRLRPSQQPVAAPIRGAVIQSGGLRPSQIALATSGVSPAVPPISSAAGGTWAGLRPSEGGLVHKGAGAAQPRIQRCGIGSSCDCPPRDKLTGIGRDLQRATAVGGTPLPAAHRERIESPGAPPIVHEVLSSPGEPLPDSHQASFEAQLGADLHEVRVHTNPQADVSARAVGALAYTVGRHLVFRRGAYAPNSTEGRRLLAHELAHVVQQQGTASSPAAQLEIGPVDDPAEREAQRFADAAVASPADNYGAIDVGTAAPRRSRESSFRQSLRRDILARYAHQDCTQDDLQSHVWPADYLARQMVAKAITALSASPVDPSVAALFPKYFMTSTPNIAAILSVFNKVSAEFADNDYTYECEEDCKSSDNGYTWGGLTGALVSAHIHLCMPKFRSLSNECLARTIVHEFTHRYAATDDHGYCKSDCAYSSCPSSLTPADALDNADSYACFAYELWGLSITSPPPLPAPPSSPPITGDGGTGDGGTGDGGTGDGGTGDGGP